MNMPFTVLTGLMVCLQTHCQEITIVSDPTCPQFCTTKIHDTQLPGYIFEIVDTIFSMEGYSFRFFSQPYARAIKNVRSGKFNAVLTSHADAPDFVFPLEAQGVYSACFYSLFSDPYVYQLSSLDGKVLGLVKGPDYQRIPQIGQYVNKYDKTENLTWLHGLEATERGFRMIQKRRIDVMAITQSGARQMMNQLELKEEIKESGCFKIGSSYIAFSPDNPQSKRYAQLLTDGMNKLRTTGKLDKILAKYNLKDWK